MIFDDSLLSRRRRARRIYSNIMKIRLAAHHPLGRAIIVIILRTVVSDREQSRRAHNNNNIIIHYCIYSVFHLNSNAAGYDVCGSMTIETEMGFFFLFFTKASCLHVAFWVNFQNHFVLGAVGHQTLKRVNILKICVLSDVFINNRPFYFTAEIFCVTIFQWNTL